MKTCAGCLATSLNNPHPPKFCPLGFEFKPVRVDNMMIHLPLDDCPRPQTQAELVAAMEILNDD
jgi:hypothetical protein